MTDLYKVLEVNRDASESEIKKAFRKQSLQYHPDRNGDKSGAELETITNKFKTLYIYICVYVCIYICV